MKQYNGEKSYVMIDRMKCQNPDCKKLHRCLPSQLTKFKHYLTEIIEDTVDDVVVPEDPKDPRDDEEITQRPTLRTVANWKEWIRHNAINIDGHLKSVGHSILGLSTQFLKSGVSLLDELRKNGGGWLATVQCIIYNSGGFLEPRY